MRCLLHNLFYSMKDITSCLEHFDEINCNKSQCKYWPSTFAKVNTEEMAKHLQDNHPEKVSKSNPTALINDDEDDDAEYEDDDDEYEDVDEEDFSPAEVLMIYSSIKRYDSVLLIFSWIWKR